jgi:hypothetical protein
LGGGTIAGSDERYCILPRPWASTSRFRRFYGVPAPQDFVVVRSPNSLLQPEQFDKIIGRELRPFGRHGNRRTVFVHRLGRLEVPLQLAQSLFILLPLRDALGEGLVLRQLCQRPREPPAVESPTEGDGDRQSHQSQIADGKAKHHLIQLPLSSVPQRPTDLTPAIVGNTRRFARIPVPHHHFHACQEAIRELLSSMRNWLCCLRRRGV